MKTWVSNYFERSLGTRTVAEGPGSSHFRDIVKELEGLANKIITKSQDSVIGGKQSGEKDKSALNDTTVPVVGTETQKTPQKTCSICNRILVPFRTYFDKCETCEPKHRAEICEQGQDRRRETRS